MSTDLKKLIFKFIGQKKHSCFLTENWKGDLILNLFCLHKDKPLFLEKINIKSETSKLLNSWLITNDLFVYVSKSKKSSMREFNFLNLKTKENKKIQKPPFYNCAHLGNNKFAILQDKFDSILNIWNYVDDTNQKIDIYNYINKDIYTIELKYITPFYNNKILVSLESSNGRIFLLVLDLIQHKQERPYFFDLAFENSNYYIQSVKFCGINTNEIAILCNYDYEHTYNAYSPFDEILIWNLRKKAFSKKPLFKYKDSDDVYIRNISVFDDEYLVCHTNKKIDLYNIRNGKIINITKSAKYIDNLIF